LEFLVMTGTDSSQEFHEPVDLAEYLFARLRQIGVQSVHGVPGDFNLLALDYIQPAGLKWVGNCNELNAGYAADGYARVKGIAAVVTKCGVGELSIVNAIAGAYSEYVPVIHIVGTPSTIARKDNVVSHHTLSNGDHRVFEMIAQQITCATVVMDGSREPAKLIDEVIVKCLVESRPVYIALPIDMVRQKVEGTRLKTLISVPAPQIDEANEQRLTQIILGYLETASTPAILVDVGTIRRRLVEDVNVLVDKLQIPTFVTPIGKGAINESLACFKGVYAGRSSDTPTLDYFKSVDFFIHIGSIKSDSTTGWFESKPAVLATTVEFPIENNGIRINGSLFSNIQPLALLRKLSDQLKVPAPTVGIETTSRGVSAGINDKEPTLAIKHNWLWPRVSQWLEEGDIVITETGTANYGIRETVFPLKTKAICQPLWSSIGYAAAACQGAALAGRELGLKRTILFTGEGSFQLSGQELSTMIRHELDPIIFIICNGGYTTERKTISLIAPTHGAPHLFQHADLLPGFIHGMDAKYNDIQCWKYTDLCNVYGGLDCCKTYQVKTRSQLEKLLSDPDFAITNCLRLVEVHMKQDDAPIGLLNTVLGLSDRG
ncbi:pyruvate decarboxylase, partial [Colletotrichum incanum]